jgi:hypothetical protein
MIRRLLTAQLLLAAALIILSGLWGCKQKNTIKTTPPPPLTPFQRDLQFVRNSNFTYVWIFSRQDGKTLDKTDADVLRKAAPHVVDWVMTDEGKKAIAGSNMDLEPENWTLLRKRFVFEDYSGK